MEKFDKEQAHKDLYELFAGISRAEDVEKLLADLCTYTEVEQLSQRLLCAKLLLKGYTYNRIIEITDISSATLSRVALSSARKRRLPRNSWQIFRRRGR